jgi:cancer susceptibility candidate protein 1
MFLDGPDKSEQQAQLPKYDTLEAVQAAAADAYGHLHHSLLSLLKGPHPDVADHPKAAALCATAEGLEHARSGDAVFTETMAVVLRALRVFSFS